MKERYQEYVGYEFIGGSRDGIMVGFEEAPEEWSDGILVRVEEEFYEVRGKKLLFIGHEIRR